MVLSRLSKKAYMWSGGALLLVAAAGIGFVVVGFVGHSKADNTPVPSAQTQASAQIIAEVGKLYQLPSGEQPTVAQVQKASLLVSQPFYKSAQNGDYVLVYKQAQLAFLYRSSQNILINVAPISTNVPQPSQNP